MIYTDPMSPAGRLIIRTQASLASQFVLVVRRHRNTPEQPSLCWLACQAGPLGPGRLPWTGVAWRGKAAKPGQSCQAHRSTLLAPYATLRKHYSVCSCAHTLAQAQAPSTRPSLSYVLRLSRRVGRGEETEIRALFRPRHPDPYIRHTTRDTARHGRHTHTHTQITQGR